MDAKPHIRHTWIYLCECISMDTLHWWGLQSMVIYQWLNIWWRKELIWRQRMQYVMSYHWCETTHTLHMNICLWMYQSGYTPLIHAAENGNLPMVEYLVEKGANMEAKNNVNDVMLSMWNHTYVTRIHICYVNESGRVDSIDICCIQW